MDNVKILIIEDNKMNMKLITSLLKLKKYQVIEAINAEIGIKLLKNHKPDLVLMDIQLPGIDGLHATRIIKSDSDLQNIPIIALTSCAMQGDKEKAIKNGCNGYITKPINTRTFLKTISKYIKQ